MQGFVSSCFGGEKIKTIGKEGADATGKKHFCPIFAVDRVTQNRNGLGPRLGHTMVFDPVRKRIVMHGGSNRNESLDDTWEWDGTRWSPIAVDATPGGRVNHGAEFDAARGHIITFGGGATWIYGLDSRQPEETCMFGLDGDRDGLIGCADPDCWARCTPLCPPGTRCDRDAPRCGDGVCNEQLETCRLCPGDCGACPALCGDHVCDPPEGHATCPGDCLP